MAILLVSRFLSMEMSARQHIEVNIKLRNYIYIHRTPLPPVFAYGGETKELRENGLYQGETKELGEGGQRPVTGVPHPGCFADISQRKDYLIGIKFEYAVILCPVTSPPARPYGRA
jgi:hypothetical protein